FPCCSWPSDTHVHRTWRRAAPPPSERAVEAPPGGRDPGLLAADDRPCSFRVRESREGSCPYPPSRDISRVSTSLLAQRRAARTASSSASLRKGLSRRF